MHKVLHACLGHASKAFPWCAGVGCSGSGGSSTPQARSTAEASRPARTPVRIVGPSAAFALPHAPTSGLPARACCAVAACECARASAASAARVSAAWSASTPRSAASAPAPAAPAPASACSRQPQAFVWAPHARASGAVLLARAGGLPGFAPDDLTDQVHAVNGGPQPGELRAATGASHPRSCTT